MTKPHFEEKDIKNVIRQFKGGEAVDELTDDDIATFSLIFHVFMDGFSSGAGTALMDLGLPMPIAEGQALRVANAAVTDPVTRLSLMQLVMRRVMHGEGYKEDASYVPGSGVQN